MVTPNLCFVRNPDEIADVMNGYSGIELTDCVGAIVGLSRIVGLQEKRISILEKNNQKLLNNQKIFLREMIKQRGVNETKEFLRLEEGHKDCFM